MTSTTYEGWTNRSTFLAADHIDNEFVAYQRKTEYLLSLRKPVTLIGARRLGFGLLTHTSIREEENFRPAEIDWPEIVEAWEAERLDLRHHAGACSCTPAQRAAWDPSPPCVKGAGVGALEGGRP